jgi:hypothetical protein
MVRSRKGRRITNWPKAVSNIIAEDLEEYQKGNESNDIALKKIN